jgi:hypothetical protein
MKFVIYLTLTISLSLLHISATANSAFSQIFCSILIGTYTVGGVNPDYNTLTDAKNALVSNGVCGPVVFNIRSGMYNEQLYLPTISGASATNTIVFQSESLDSSLVTITHNSGSNNNYVIFLNSTEYFTFQHLTLEATNSQYNKVIDMNSDNHNIQILNNHLISQPSSSTGWQHIIGSETNGDNNNNFTIRNNWMEYGDIGVYFSASIGQGDLDNVVENNLITNQWYTGIYAKWQEDLVVANNEIHNNQNPSWDNYKGIFFDDVTGADSELSGNYIHDINGIGIGVNSSYGASTSHLPVFNNMVSVNQNPTNPNATQQGLSISSCNYVDVFHNSVHLVNSGDWGLVFIIQLTSYSDVHNNIFTTSGTGKAYYIWNTANLNWTSENNLLYSNGPTLATWSLTSSNWTDYPDLTSFSAATGYETNGVFGNPNFISDYDLHILTNPLIAGAGASLGLGYDIDGDSRQTPPDIGADEFQSIGLEVNASSVSTPVTNCGPGNVEATFTNNGANTITSVELHWRVNGVPQTPFNWAGSVSTGNTSSLITLGSYSFQAGNTYNIDVWTENPNGGVDAFPDNDTISTTFDFDLVIDLGSDTTVCANENVELNAPGGYTYLWNDNTTDSSLATTASGTYYVTVTNDFGCVATDTVNVNWFPVTPQPTITVNLPGLLSSSPTGNQWYVNGGIIPNETSQIYEVILNGYYQVEVTDTNGCTTISDSIYIDLIYYDVVEVSADRFSADLFPNPNNGQFQLDIQTKQNSQMEWEVLDVAGRVVQHEQLGKVRAGNTSIQINLSTIERGVYMIRLTDGRKIQILKFTKF